MRQADLVIDNNVGRGGVFVYHKPAAHRIVGARREAFAGSAIGAKAHAIRVKGQRLLAVKDQVVAVAKGNVSAA